MIKIKNDILTDNYENHNYIELNFRILEEDTTIKVMRIKAGHDLL